MDTRRKQPGATCYWFINYAAESTRLARSPRDHYCPCSGSRLACDLCQNSTGLMQNESPPVVAAAAEVRPRSSGGDRSGQMIKTSRLRSRSDKTVHPEQQQQHNPDTATRPRPRRGLGRSRHPAGSIHSFIMLTLLNLILLLYHLEARPSGPRNARSLFAQAEESESMIEVRRFLVPAQVRPGELRRLACQYELHGASLHAMKLFKDDKEFYRYTPSNPPGDQRLSFPGAGVQVDMSRSGEREVWLKINKRSTGQYRCQVTIEGKFISVSAEKRMEVITGTGSPSSDTPGAGAQTGGNGSGGGGMWSHHPAGGSGGPRVPPATYLNQDQLPVRRLPGEMYGLNTVMQSSVGVPTAAPARPVLCACLLLATVAAAASTLARSLLLVTTRARAR